MGKRRFAGTLAVPGHSTTSSKYGKHITAWIRGWEQGIEVQTLDCGDGVDGFEIYICGGSNPGQSNGRRLIGKVINGEFVRVQ